VVFSDDARGQGFRGERAGGSRRALDVEKRDALSVRRECRRVDVAVEFGDTVGGAAIQMREKKIGLASGLAVLIVGIGGIGAIGEEGDRRGVRRPDEI
jgi:hypothetical protein